MSNFLLLTHAPQMSPCVQQLIHARDLIMKAATLTADALDIVYEIACTEIVDGIYSDDLKRATAEYPSQAHAETIYLPLVKAVFDGSPLSNPSRAAAIIEACVGFEIEPSVAQRQKGGWTDLVNRHKGKPAKPKKVAKAVSKPAQRHSAPAKKKDVRVRRVRIICFGVWKRDIESDSDDDAIIKATNIFEKLDPSEWGEQVLPCYDLDSEIYDIDLDDDSD